MPTSRDLQRMVLEQRARAENEVISGLRTCLDALESNAQTIIEAKDQEIEKLKVQVNEANDRTVNRSKRLDLLIEKCDEVKPVLQQLLLDLDQQLSPDQKKKLEDFISFSIPFDTPPQQPKPAPTIPGLSNVVTGLQSAWASTLQNVGAMQPPPSPKVQTPLPVEKEEVIEEPEPKPDVLVVKDGEVPFDDQVDVSQEVEYWSESLVRPLANNTVTLIKDPNDPASLMPIAYTFKITYQGAKPKSTPTFHLDRDEITGNSLLRFRAGSPYQDLCYRISAKDWFMDDDHGFSCVFEKNVLTLKFSLKLNH